MNYKIRRWEKSDANILAKRMNNIHIWTKLTDFTPLPYTREDAVAYIARSIRDSKSSCYGIFVDGEVVGAVDFKINHGPYAITAMLNFWIDELDNSEQIIVEVLTDLSRHLFTHQPIIKVIAPILDSDTQKIVQLEKVGFTHEATIKRTILKSGKIHDLQIYSMTE